MPFCLKLWLTWKQAQPAFIKGHKQFKKDKVAKTITLKMRLKTEQFPNTCIQVSNKIWDGSDLTLPYNILQ